MDLDLSETCRLLPGPDTQARRDCTGSAWQGFELGQTIRLTPFDGCDFSASNPPRIVSFAHEIIRGEVLQQGFEPRETLATLAFLYFKSHESHLPLTNL